MDGELVYNYTPPDPEKQTTAHVWTLVGPLGGVHIWAGERDQEWVTIFGNRYSGGVEMHSPRSLYGDDKPNHDKCWLIGGPCWHDGTSLYFSERIGPMLGDAPFPARTHEYVNSELRYFYRTKFEETE